MAKKKKKEKEILGEELEMVVETTEETTEVDVEKTEKDLKEEIDKEFDVETEELDELIIVDMVEEPIIVEDKVEEVMDFSKMSTVDRRYYQRTGRLRKNI